MSGSVHRASFLGRRHISASGTASHLAYVAAGMLLCLLAARAESPPNDRLVRDKYGAIVRGNTSEKKLALVFTGDEFGESTEPILDTLNRRKIRASLFVTGNFVRQPALRRLLERAIVEGHYVGPHSDKHLLYAAWDEHDKSLVTQEAFKTDLARNISDLRTIGLLRREEPTFFIPPYEYYNRDQVEWSRAMGVTSFTFTPGSGSNRDYAPEGDAHFVSSQKIYDGILSYEKQYPHGLNGFILLMHLGSGRKDPFHPRLGALCDELAKRGYKFARIDSLLARP